MPSLFPLRLKNCFLDEGKEIYEKLTCLFYVWLLLLFAIFCCIANTITNVF